MPKTNLFQEQDQADADLELLEVVIESGKLSPKEEEAFQDMLSRLRERRVELTTNQRAWVRRTKLEIDLNHSQFELLASVLGASNRLRDNERGGVHRYDRRPDAFSKDAHGCSAHLGKVLC